MSGSLPRRDNGLTASSYVRLDDVETHLVDELLERLRDAGVAAYSAPTAGRRGPYGEMVPPLGPSDSVYVDAAHPGRARAVADLYLREIRDDIAWSDIVAGYDADPGDTVPRWPVSEDVDPEDETDDEPGNDPAYEKETPEPTIGFEELRSGRPAPLEVDDPNDHYQPPPPPPLPDIDRVARFAWAGTLGGPLVLVLAAVLGLRLEGWVGFLAVAAFVAGFVTLIARMKDRPPTDSGPDDGAVV